MADQMKPMQLHDQFAKVNNVESSDKNQTLLSKEKKK